MKQLESTNGNALPLVLVANYAPNPQRLRVFIPDFLQQWRAEFVALPGAWWHKQAGYGTIANSSEHLEKLKACFQSRIAFDME